VPQTRRLLVAALAFVTLSLNPFESFAGPLQGAIHRYPPDWLTRTGPGPKRTYLGMSCGGKILMGLGIGAAIGAGYMTFVKTAYGVETSPDVAIGVPLTFGIFGTAAAYNMCR
jgi:hypothetical protein